MNQSQTNPLSPPAAHPPAPESQEIPDPVDALVQAQVPEKFPVLCGDCKWSGEVVFFARQDDPLHADWKCPNCGATHVVKIRSSEPLSPETET